MKVIVDNKIPYIREAIETLIDEVLYLPGGDITREEVKDADALIIRTRTAARQQGTADCHSHHRLRSH